MSSEELKNIIEKFDEENLKKEGIFGIYHGGGPVESFIRANKEGLELFALKLLKASKSYENLLEENKVSEQKEKNVIFLDYDEDWVDENSETFIQYIEPLDYKQIFKPKEDYKETIPDKLMPWGCGLVLLILAISVIVGLQTIFNWFF